MPPGRRRIPAAETEAERTAREAREREREAREAVARESAEFDRNIGIAKSQIAGEVDALQKRISHLKTWRPAHRIRRVRDKAGTIFGWAKGLFWRGGKEKLSGLRKSRFPKRKELENQVRQLQALSSALAAEPQRLMPLIKKNGFKKVAEEF